jgi:hypothetical protein
MDLIVGLVNLIGDFLAALLRIAADLVGAVAGFLTGLLGIFGS